MSQPNHQKAPYPPAVWSLGGPTEKHIDVPVQAVFLVLFMIGAATHMTIFQLNRKRAHKFIPNAAIFGFCMSRIVTMTLRIASACLPHDIQLGIAAQIFVSAGVLILFIVNLIFAQRLVRSMHPSIGWHTSFSIFFKIIYILVGCTLVINITSVVQTFYTLDQNIRRIDRDLQLYGSTFLAVVATLPLILTLAAILVPHPTHDRFGAGRLRTKATGLLIATTLLSFGAWYRCACSWHTPISRKEPLPGFLGKAPFYMVNFTVEILAVYMYAIIRIDLRFHIPDGARGPGSYSKPSSLEPVETPITRPSSQGDDENKTNMENKEETNSAALTDYDVEKGKSAPVLLAEGSNSHST